MAVGSLVVVRLPYLFVNTMITLKLVYVNTKIKVFYKLFLGLIFRFFSYIIESNNSQERKCCGVWKYKIDILKELSNRGYTSTKLRKNKIISEGSMQHIRNGKGISIDTLNTICLILRLEPSDIIEIIPTDEEKIKYF